MFAQSYAWAHQDLCEEARETLLTLAGEKDSSLVQLRDSLHTLLERKHRDPTRFHEGRTLKLLWDLEGAANNFRDLERKLRIVVVRRAQSKLYSLLLQCVDYDCRQRRELFLNFCWHQVGQQFEDKGPNLLHTYHKEYGGKVEDSCLLLQRNLFPSLAEQEASMCAWKRGGRAVKRKPRANRNRRRAGSPPREDSRDQRDECLSEMVTVDKDACEAWYGTQAHCSHTERDHSESGDAHWWFSGTYEGGTSATKGGECESPEDCKDQRDECLSEIANVDKYACEAWYGAQTQYSHTERDHSECGDTHWWYNWAYEEETSAPNGGEVDIPELKPYSKVLVLLELVHVLVWIDKQCDWTTSKYCDVDRVESTWVPGGSYRMHYRLESMLSMLARHDTCVLGVTFCNQKHDDFGGSMLCELLQVCTGDQWVYCDASTPCYAYNSNSSKKIYVWTPKDGITQTREAEGKHRYSKTCGKIWQDLTSACADGSRFNQYNTICLDLSKSNFDHLDNVILAHAWNGVWCRGIAEDEPEDSIDERDEHLKVFLEDILDNVGENCIQDVREQITTYSGC
eukprot:TRINITY_DN972_c0_g1_i1.p1 TRINITY_DN972_c0_g1~~TRINITY_DN972_c0_g1_i1.p1  ORF type:complete len:600 (-),score=59.54 TRINITY_DN972_c0_g1_i1:449-2152(-)